MQELWSRAKNPLNALLLTLATVSYFLGDMRAAIVIASMVVLAIMTAFMQEHRSNEAAAKWRNENRRCHDLRVKLGAEFWENSALIPICVFPQSPEEGVARHNPGHPYHRRIDIICACNSGRTPEDDPPENRRQYKRH